MQSLITWHVCATRSAAELPIAVDGYGQSTPISTARFSPLRLILRVRESWLGSFEFVEGERETRSFKVFGDRRSVPYHSSLRMVGN